MSDPLSTHSEAHEVCGKRCAHDSECLLRSGHKGGHETQHGCIFYDARARSPAPGGAVMLAWHFLAADARIAYLGTPAHVGLTLRHDGPLALCSSGLHASVRPLDALRYAPGPVACLVECGGETMHGSDKLVCRERTIVAMLDATELLRAFSRECALDVIHLWDAPPLVRRWLESGDENLRDAAWAAAWAAARDAAWAAAGAAARAAAGDAAGDAQNDRLESMLLGEML